MAELTHAYKCKLPVPRQPKFMLKLCFEGMEGSWENGGGWNASYSSVCLDDVERDHIGIGTTQVFTIVIRCFRRVSFGLR